MKRFGLVTGTLIPAFVFGQVGLRSDTSATTGSAPGVPQTDDISAPSNGAVDGSKGFWDQFAANYATWDVLKVLWVAATLSMSYAISTFAYLMLLKGRSPMVAARYALFWGALALVLIHLFGFGLMLQSGLEVWMVVGIIIGIPLLVIAVLMFMRKRR